MMWKEQLSLDSQGKHERWEGKSDGQKSDFC